MVAGRQHSRLSRGDSRQLLAAGRGGRGCQAGPHEVLQQVARRSLPPAAGNACEVRRLRSAARAGSAGCLQTCYAARTRHACGVFPRLSRRASMDRMRPCVPMLRQKDAACVTMCHNVETKRCSDAVCDKTRFHSIASHIDNAHHP